MEYSNYVTASCLGCGEVLDHEPLDQDRCDKCLKESNISTE